jgi:hypothetical protein
MNFIHSEKTIWILPERTATRTIGQLLNFWEVDIFEGDQFKTCVPHKNMQGSFSQELRHEWKVYDFFEDYDVLLNVRNPYTRIKSYYHSLFLKNDCAGSGDCDLTFEGFLDKYCKFEGGMLDHLRFDQIFEKRPPKLVIRYENLGEDLIKIPFIHKKYEESEEFRQEWNRVVEKNIFNKETLNESYKYTESEAEKVYRSFENQFKLFGYPEDSWKYL